jgi:eukaryotic-like serine/threonine-protein kinase
MEAIMALIDNAGEFADAVCSTGLLEGALARELAGPLRKRFSSAGDLASELVRRGWLTSYQSGEAISGRAGELVLGSYVLLEPLGEGGMGRVFKARHRLMNRLVAIKVICPELLKNRGVVQRFRREARLAARLNHPNVVLAHDAQEVNGRHFLVMEYVEGITLAELIRCNGPLPAGEIADYGRQAALGLEHAHAQGLIHRDIKPANLLIAGQVVKVADLGLARLDADGPLDSAATEVGQVLGTVDFLAPEQAADSRRADARSDLYSLGCTLYYGLTGEVPFPDGTRVEKLLRHRLEAPQPLEQLRPDVPVGLCAVVARLMAKQPADRYPSAAAVAAALSPWCSSTAPVSSRDVTPLDPCGGTDVCVPSIPPLFPARAGDDSVISPPAPTEVPDVKRKRFTRRRVLVAAGLAGLGLTAVGFVLVRGRLGPTHPEPSAAQQWRAGPVVDERMPGEVGGVAISPDGQYAAVACGKPGQPHDPGAIGLVSLTTGAFIPLGTHKKAARRVVFNRDGTKLISATGVELYKELLIGELRFWDVRKRVEQEERCIPDALTASILDLATDRQGTWVALAGRNPIVQLRDLATGRVERCFEVHFRNIYTAVAFSSDGALLAAGTADGRLWVWRVASGGEVCAVLGDTAERAITGLAFCPGDRQIVGATAESFDGKARIKVWNLDSCSLAYHIARDNDSFHGMALAPDGNIVATACQERVVCLWDLKQRRLIQELSGHTAAVRAVAFAADGRLLASAGSDKTIRLWVPAGV